MKKKPARKKLTKKEVIETFDDQDMSVSEPLPYLDPIPSPRKEKNYLWVIIPLLLVGGLLVLFAVKRGFFLAAVVNGEPVFRWDLDRVLTDRYGQQTLEGIITERLIAKEAEKQGVAVTPQDIEGRTQEILASFGANVPLEEILKFQGMKKEDFDKQVKLQLMVQKLLTKDLTITEQDINNFIATNRALLVATEEGKLREEARKAITEQTMNEKLEGFLQEIKEKATVQRFL